MNSRVILASLLTFLVAGCGIPIGASSLNDGLMFKDSLETRRAKENDPKSVRAQYLSEMSSIVLLRPGMKLRVVSTTLEASSNKTIPSISQYEWVVPTDTAISEEDVRFVSFLLAAAYLPKGKAKQDSGGYLRAREEKVKRDERDFSQLARDAIVPIIRSMAVDYQRYQEQALGADPLITRRNKFCHPQASALRDLLDSPDDRDKANAISVRTVLSFTVYDPPNQDSEKTLLEYSFFSTPFLGSVGSLAGDRRSSSYLSNAVINGHLGGMSVFVPIRIGKGAERIFVPICWTYAELEAQFGVEVLGFARRRELIDFTPSPSYAPFDELRDLQYHRVRFVNGNEWITGNGFLANVKDKGSIVVAPDDIVVVGRLREVPHRDLQK